MKTIVLQVWGSKTGHVFVVVVQRYLLNKLKGTFLLVSQFRKLGMLFTIVYGQVQQHTTKELHY